VGTSKKGEAAGQSNESFNIISTTKVRQQRQHPAGSSPWGVRGTPSWERKGLVVKKQKGGRCKNATDWQPVRGFLRKRRKNAGGAINAREKTEVRAHSEGKGGRPSN